MALSSMELASAIRAMGVWTPITFLWHADDLVRSPDPHQVLLPGLWREILAQLDPPISQARHDETESVLEYHAPLKRRRQAC